MTMETTPEPSGSGTAAKIRRAADGISNTLNVIGTIMILGLVILVNADVIGRNAFLAPISGVPEIVSMSIVAIVFLQVSQAFRMGRFTRTDALLDAVARRSKRARNAMEFIYVIAAFVLIWLLFSASVPLFDKSWQRQSYVGTVGDFTFPDWPVKLVILIGCAALLMQLAISGAVALWGIFHPAEDDGAGQ
ncbi:TRAP transporter small permease [Hoeflea sp. WL0058]|uniref:TRAP transporter small permease protein n=1 Tax=Flavimaribacter sediminis TaxID=2865987 RepID=A0AAE2ZQG4_9HYPH|nr:TRAP transporter small permease [Flavimaribacter sediminis]MBW8637787.1 TRAP transporter small permease [Flavimaribacter sediminis]